MIKEEIMSKKIDVLSLKGEKVKDIKLEDNIFNIEPNDAVVKDAIVAAMAGARQGTASVKTRAEVSGGGRKPYRQKGTGNARQGSIRATQYRHGGIAFGPVPRDYSKKMNKKEKRAALKSALTAKVEENKFIVIDEIALSEIKTKSIANMLKGLDVSKALVVLEDGNVNAEISARNIADVKTAKTNTINVFDVLKYNTVVATKAAVASIEEVYA